MHITHVIYFLHFHVNSQSDREGQSEGSSDFQVKRRVKSLNSKF